ncbi:MAG: 3-isopropylmalate dehydratase small subunit [Rhodospirillaceae bacterium]
MKQFTVLTGVAAPLPLMNVDTDTIIPARYLKTIGRTGLGKAAFHALRYNASGAESPDFILNRPPYRETRILITGANFGCGSSREHAPWSLLDFGIACVIAPSFADIFHNNCLKNGILCIALPVADVEALMAKAGSGNTAGGNFSVDLERQSITAPDGTVTPFDLDPAHRRSLLEGLDEIGLTLRGHAQIADFEARQKAALPWLTGDAS